MSCIEVTFDGANDPVRCKCQNAVLKAYNALKGDNVPDDVALDAAKRVYRFHHPEDSILDSALTVERWVHQGQFQ